VVLVEVGEMVLFEVGEITLHFIILFYYLWLNTIALAGSNAYRGHLF